MSVTAEKCEVCQRRAAAVFMVMRQDASAGRQRVTKVHVCFTCFGLAEEKSCVRVEAVSLQEFKEVKETWREMLGER